MSQELIREVDSRLIIYFDLHTNKWHPAILPEAQRDATSPLIQPFVRFDVERRICGVIGAKDVWHALIFCQKRAKQITGRHLRAFPGPKQPLPSAAHVQALHRAVLRRRNWQDGGW